MRTIAGHTEVVLALASPRRESRLLVDATGHILAAPATSRLSIPPFDNSAMDGFIAHDADLGGEGPWTLPVAGDIPAGAQPVDCPPGAAVRVMTGAAVPRGGDLVVIPVEQTDVAAGPVPLPETVTIHARTPGRSHIRRAGGDIAPGDVVAEAGTVCDAATVAALVSAGVREVEVFARPTVAVITTGDELVSWPDTPEGATIPNSNLPMLARIAKDAGAASVVELHAGDRAGGEHDFRRVLERAASQYDVVVTSGGVSAGAYDVVKEVTAGATMWFGHVAQRPGGPQGVGSWGSTPLVCLPGNPVAAFVSAHLYLWPLVRAAAGHTTGLRLNERAHIRARIGDGFPQPHPELERVVPVTVTFGPEGARAAAFSARAGSHMVGSLAGVNGFAVLPAGARGAEPAPEADVWLTRL
ncbi:molybdopterin molybdotransferase MoeA [Corynebacterium sp. Q4381]|uniref:molybdopterin molybdotransferase MoeA n=1 Tax=Corynebacterium sp. Marseille-Q4381 TaxID=3121597 RepID=UPI002FE6312B